MQPPHKARLDDHKNCVLSSLCLTSILAAYNPEPKKPAADQPSKLATTMGNSFCNPYNNKNDNYFDDNYFDHDWNDCLLNAVYRNEIDKVSRLIEQEGGHWYASRIYEDRGYITPLHVACSDGLMDMVLLLLEQGANIHAQDDEGESPLYKALRYGHLDVAKELVYNHGAYLHPRVGDAASGRNNGTVVHAVSGGRMGRHVIQVLEWLVLEQGMDINAVDCRGMTPLHYSCAVGRPSTVRWLLNHGANPLIRDANGRVALDHALRRSDFYEVATKFVYGGYFLESVKLVYGFLCLR